MSNTDLLNSPQGAPTSRIEFHVPGNSICIKTNYLVASALEFMLPMYATRNPSQFFKINIGKAVRYAIPANTAITVSHDEIADNEDPAQRRIIEKLTTTLNDDLRLFFDESGNILS